MIDDVADQTAPVLGSDEGDDSNSACCRGEISRRIILAIARSYYSTDPRGFRCFNSHRDTYIGTGSPRICLFLWSESEEDEIMRDIPIASFLGTHVCLCQCAPIAWVGWPCALQRKT